MVPANSHGTSCCRLVQSGGRLRRTIERMMLDLFKLVGLDGLTGWRLGAPEPFRLLHRRQQQSSLLIDGEAFRGERKATRGAARGAVEPRGHAGPVRLVRARKADHFVALGVVQQADRAGPVQGMRQCAGRQSHARERLDDLRVGFDRGRLAAVEMEAYVGAKCLQTGDKRHTIHALDRVPRGRCLVRKVQHDVLMR